jgi:hypothetical protein
MEHRTVAKARALIVKKLTCDLEPPVVVILAGCDFLLRITLVVRDSFHMVAQWTVVS